MGFNNIKDILNGRNAVGVPKLRMSTFNKIRNIVYQRSGIFLREDKSAIIAARLAKRMRMLDIGDYEEYFQYVTEDETANELQHMMNAISTNVTGFYRESDHFVFMRNAVKKWINEGIRDLRFWSAACSTGEEPYTMAIEIAEEIRFRSIKVKILATDISSRVLEISLLGEYSEEKVAPVANHIREKYFVKVRRDERNYYAVNDKLKKMVIFRKFNISSPPFPIKSSLNMIFCRNVMMYFDNAVRAKVVEEFHRLIKPGGYLIVGHAESISNLTNSFECIKPSIYLKKDY